LNSLSKRSVTENPSSSSWSRLCGRTQAAGSIYEVELNGAGSSDLINVTAAATFNGDTVA
jgi:hypothetical protein